MKPFLSILTTVPLLLTSLHLEAKKIKANLKKNPFSLDYFIGFPFNDVDLNYGRLGLGYQPLDNNQLITNVSLEHYFNQNKELNNLDFETKFMNLRWSVGYSFVIDNSVTIAPSLGITLDLTDFNPIKTQTYTSLRLEYNVTNTFALFMEGIYDFESHILPHNEAIGFGVKYTPNYKPLTTNLACCEPETKSTNLTPQHLASEFGSVIPVFETAAENQYANMRFTIQIGAFSNKAAASVYLEQSLTGLEKSHIRFRELNGLVKIYYKGYNDFDIANDALENLKAKRVDSFVINTPPSENQ